MNSAEFVHYVATMNRNEDHYDIEGVLDGLIVSARKILHDEQGVEVPTSVDST